VFVKAFFAAIQSSVTPCRLMDKCQRFSGIFKPATFLCLQCRRINKLEASEMRNTFSVFAVIFCRSLCNFCIANESSICNNVGNCDNKTGSRVFLT
jgi:hypothetical protein